MSKSQREATIRTQKEARTRACAGANCSKADYVPTDIPIEGGSTSLTTPIPTPTTPTRIISPALLVSTPATRFRSVEPTNRFTPLLKFA
jgi:hypothetical protein